jgi:hypothetical protein
MVEISLCIDGCVRYRLEVVITKEVEKKFVAAAEDHT